MKRFALLLLGIATPVGAAERRQSVDDFDRIRVEGPYEVHVATRGVPGARITGSPTAADSVEIHVDGRTLTVRPAVQDGGEQPHGGARDAPVIYLRTTDLRGAGVVAGGKLEVSGPMRAARIDLQLTGSGTLTASALDAEQLIATLIGNGTMTLGGRAGSARLLSSGAGTIAATQLRIDMLTLRLEGTGTTQASARYTANVVSTGLGAVTVYGKPKCTVRAPAAGTVVCGATAPAP
jgi:hypothetical protein